MGEEKKMEGGDSNNSTTDTKGETKKDMEEVEYEIVLKVDMHCEACAKKVVKVVGSFPGVGEVGVDRKANTVVVKAGKTVDPAQLCHRILKKSGRKAQLLSPLPNAHQQPPSQPQPKQDNHQPPPVITVTLQVYMHCEACAQILRKRIRKIKGVESVETDVGKDRVMVKGTIADPSELVKEVYKRTRKQVSIVVPDEEKKQVQEAKEGDSKEKKDGMNEGSAGRQEASEADTMTMMSEAMNRYEYYWPTRYNCYNNTDYYMTNLINYLPQHQVFSDENPNACTIM